MRKMFLIFIGFVIDVAIIVGIITTTLSLPLSGNGGFDLILLIIALAGILMALVGLVAINLAIIRCERKQNEI